MKVYLVRHARSEARDMGIRQSPNSKLGLTGKKQAQLLVPRVKKEKIDIVFTSPWERAKSTATILSQKLNLPLETFEEIHEKLQSKKVYGASNKSRVHKEFMKEKEKFGVDIDWKFAGEGESVRDLTKRVNEFQKHLIKKHNVQNILVVTHDFFIRSFVCTALLGEKYDEKSFMKIFGSISCVNTGLTLFDYDKKRKHWELVYFNEHLHLG